MKKILSILLVAIATLTLASCHKDQKAIQKLNDVVTNFEQQYDQMTEEDMALVKDQYAKALEEVAKYRYTQADNELIGDIKARYDMTVVKYEARFVFKEFKDFGDKVQETAGQIYGYGKKIIQVVDSLIEDAN